ncbi:MAG TPA: sugar kinase [Puia sp.]|nr:sugar kinase [Puia sp.]
MGFVLCFGECLLRYAPDLGGNWLERGSIPVYLGGAEANVAAALAKWGVKVQYFSALPENYVSRQMATYLSRRGIDTSKILYFGSRFGSYSLPIDADLKNRQVIYDREHSSFSQLAPGMIDWNWALENVDWFHFSAIAPALSENVALVCEEALIAAQARNIKISVDLNFRNKLWQYGRQPYEIMTNLLRSCNVIMGNIWAAAVMAGAPDPGALTENNDREFFIEHSLQSSLYIMNNFPRCRMVANTFRFERQNEIEYYATLFADQQLHTSRVRRSEVVIDKVGSGDCFMAGLILGTLEEMDFQSIVEFSTAAAFEKLFVKGDFTNKTFEMIKASAFP